MSITFEELCPTFAKGKCCRCGDVLYSVTEDKFRAAALVKDTRDRLNWEWVCRKCGTVMREQVNMVVHTLEKEFDDYGR